MSSVALATASDSNRAISRGYAAAALGWFLLSAVWLWTVSNPEDSSPVRSLQ